ncbi:uncharacterized protein LOC126481777 [Schistocerca serialis cubense]|uniref:uncharacterized protein LOC126481777 n=1 Tax=Schistocerca serialis cubense TaxID=2023355 RepID=UPI00214E579E|nr:uncharacterized protein LOC126481777 [Schistocerca serialis cubense]
MSSAITLLFGDQGREHGVEGNLCQELENPHQQLEKSNQMRRGQVCMKRGQRVGQCTRERHLPKKWYVTQSLGGSQQRAAQKAQRTGHKSIERHSGKVGFCPAWNKWQSWLAYTKLARKECRQASSSSSGIGKQVKKIILAPVISVKPVGVWCNKSALDLQTLRKIIAIKSFVKCLLAKLSQDDIEKFYVLLSSVAAGMLTIEGLKPSLTEMSWLRLTSGCSILKLCSSKFFWQKLKLKQFVSLTTLLYDADEYVTKAFLAKLSLFLSNKRCPVDFFSLYAFIGMIMQTDQRRDLNSLFSNTVNAQWQYIRRQYKIHEDHFSFEVFINKHQDMLPDSSIVALVCLLASSWKVERNLVRKCLEFFFSVMLQHQFADIRLQKEYYLELFEAMCKSRVLDISDKKRDKFNANVRSIRQMAEVLIGKMWLKGSETYQVVPDFPRRYFHLEQVLAGGSTSSLCQPMQPSDSWEVTNVTACDVSSFRVFRGVVHQDAQPIVMTTTGRAC